MSEFIDREKAIANIKAAYGERKSSRLIRSSQCCRTRGLNFVV